MKCHIFDMQNAHEIEMGSYNRSSQLAQQGASDRVVARHLLYQLPSRVIARCFQSY